MTLTMTRPGLMGRERFPSPNAPHPNGPRRAPGVGAIGHKVIITIATSQKIVQPVPKYQRLRYTLLTILFACIRTTASAVPARCPRRRPTDEVTLGFTQLFHFLRFFSQVTHIF